MALIPKIEFIGVNKNATEMYIRNTTGAYNATTNPNGYGTPNTTIAQISKIIFTVSAFSDSEVYTYDTEPIVDVVAGNTITITPQELGAEEGFSFEDGVYDINEYDVTLDVIDFITLGTNSITVGNPITLDQYNKYNVIADNNNNIYNIDKSVPFDLNRIDVVEPLASGITNLSFGYRANTKADVTASIDYRLASLATDPCGCKDEQELIKLYFHKAMAQIAMDNQDYKRANILVSGTFNRGCC